MFSNLFKYVFSVSPFLHCTLVAFYLCFPFLVISTLFCTLTLHSLCNNNTVYSSAHYFLISHQYLLWMNSATLLKRKFGELIGLIVTVTTTTVCVVVIINSSNITTTIYHLFVSAHTCWVWFLAGRRIFGGCCVVFTRQEDTLHRLRRAASSGQSGGYCELLW